MIITQSSLETAIPSAYDAGTTTRKTSRLLGKKTVISNFSPIFGIEATPETVNVINALLSACHKVTWKNLGGSRVYHTSVCLQQTLDKAVAQMQKSPKHGPKFKHLRTSAYAVARVAEELSASR